jgi:hypothetical protein
MPGVIFPKEFHWLTILFKNEVTLQVQSQHCCSVPTLPPLRGKDLRKQINGVETINPAPMIFEKNHWQ